MAFNFDLDSPRFCDPAAVDAEMRRVLEKRQPLRVACAADDIEVPR
jgi:hypothetical protein